VADSERVFFIHQGRPTIGFYPLEDEGLRITDEVDHIELLLSAEDVERLHNLLKNKQTMITASKQDTVFQDLLRQFQEKKLVEFDGKPFLVYDIETTFDGRAGEQEFAIAYAIDSSEDHTEKLSYQYIDRDGLRAFAQQLLDYPGWVVGFNQISFDNPITMLQAGFSIEDLAIVQAKSLDPFQLVRGMTGRRMSLQAMATALIDAGKTLSSGAEGQDLLDKWFRDGNIKALEKVKEYCKNDVQITLGVFLYMIRYQSVDLDGKHLVLDNKAFLQYGSRVTDTEEQFTDAQVSLF
jgi:uncharacterized protein YprB with RNaseH-like and TPR domain